MIVVDLTHRLFLVLMELGLIDFSTLCPNKKIIRIPLFETHACDIEICIVLV